MLRPLNLLLQRIPVDQLERAAPARFGEEMRDHVHDVVDADVPVGQIRRGRFKRPVDDQRSPFDVVPRYESPVPAAANTPTRLRFGRPPLFELKWTEWIDISLIPKRSNSNLTYGLQTDCNDNAVRCKIPLRDFKCTDSQPQSSFRYSPRFCFPTRGRHRQAHHVQTS